ncbi:MAG: radical SAM protein [Clostridia bacterium]|nr:radical SAM protein [Clostridia bacterium]
MNFTLHLTADCNLNCVYCYEKHSPVRMDMQTAIAACDLMFSFGHKKNGFSLFGGEPLLCRSLIERLTAYAAERNKALGGELSYKLTTNGVLLDEEFLQLADDRNIEIALSHDGLLQDIQRVDKAGRGTAERLEPKIDLLLRRQPDAVAMLTVIPQHVERLAESVEWLYRRGFSRVNSVIDMRPDAGWDDASTEKLAAEYFKIADLMEAHYDSARPLRYLNFTSKIAARLEDRPCIECRLGIKQPSIAPDGRIYPCNQFLNNEEFLMGDVFTGIDAEKQRRIYEESLKAEDTCVGCSLEKRCRHHCACLNHSLTGNMHEVPPVQCMEEQAVILAADALAARLYEKKSPRFMSSYGE